MFEIQKVHNWEFQCRNNQQFLKFWISVLIAGVSSHFLKKRHHATAGTTRFDKVHNPGENGTITSKIWTAITEPLKVYSGICGGNFKVVEGYWFEAAFENSSLNLFFS